MKVITNEIIWHGKDPIFTVDVQKRQNNNQPLRIATGGLDCNIRIWEVKPKEFRFLSNLSRHEKSVNIVRFSNSGQYLASAADDNILILWKRSNEHENIPAFNEDDKDNLETWNVFKSLRGHLEDINDLQWSKDDTHIITGSVDRVAILWNVEKCEKVRSFNEAKHFVNGVTIDPLFQYAVTMSSDRSMRVYKLNTKKHRMPYTVTRARQKRCLKNKKGNETNSENEPKEEEKLTRLFADESVVRRRLSFTSDGELLIVPAGLVNIIDDKNNCETLNSTLMFSRHNLQKPLAYFPSLKDPTSIVSICPILFQKRPGKVCMLKMDFRYVFAVASCEEIFFYDTQSPRPFAYVSHIHYATITDISWSKDASFLMVSSRDGFCSKLMFEDGEIGLPYEEGVEKESCESTNIKAETVLSNDSPIYKSKIKKSELATNTKMDEKIVEKSDNAMEVDVQITGFNKSVPKKQEIIKNNKNNSRRIQFTTIS